MSLTDQAVQAVYARAQTDGVASFYAYRRNAPFWLARSGVPAPGVPQVLEILKRAHLDGLADGPALAAQAELAIAEAQAGDPVKVAVADQLLSSAWVRYMQALNAPAPGVEYAVPYLAPRPVRGDSWLFDASRAPALEDYVRTKSDVNPLYAQLRNTVWQQVQTGALAPDRRVLNSLDRLRILPATGRFILIDSASARLFMVEDGHIRDSMKVVVGMYEDAKTRKPTPQLKTPMMVSVISYATFNPYWHVPPHLTTNVAKGVVAAGLGALKPNRYQVVNAYVEKPIILDPATINWKAVAAGQEKVALRQLPGPNNSMGALKFQFPNVAGIYLHDTNHREYFKESKRMLSNGCIRLEDAKRLGRWLLGRDPVPPTPEPEQHVQLPQGMPIYVTYLTTQVEGEKLTFLPDHYGWDSMGGTTRVALQ